MLRKEYRFFSALSSILIIFTILFGLTANAFAGTSEGTENKEVSVEITNILRAKPNIYVPNASFEYVYTKDGLVNFQNSGAEALNREVFEDSTQPDLKNTESQLKADYTKYTSAYPNMIDNKKIYKLVGGNIIPDNDDFKHAGVYAYTINQKLLSEGMFKDYLNCSKAEYKLFIYVENGDDGVAVSGVTVYKVKDDNGEAIESPSKANLDENTYAPRDGSDLVFINDYNPDNVGFSIVCEISGKYADMTKTFDYEMTMSNPEGVTEEHTYKAVKIDENTNLPISDELLSFTTGKVTSFQMNNNERIVFVKSDYVINKEKELTTEETEFLPAGATFKFVSKAAQAYYCIVTPTFGGYKSNSSMGNIGKDFTTDKMYLNLGQNQLHVNQCHKNIAVTGVIAKIMPALILLLFAICGIVLGGSSRRRNAAE